jgi:hypothetical protein
MKPHVSFDILKANHKAMLAVFHKVATLDDFQKVFQLQAFSKVGGLINAVSNHCTGNPALIRRMEEYVGNSENYSVILKSMIRNIHLFENVIIPNRDADFCVEEANKQATFFWIEERIEVDVDLINNRFHIAKLMVDSKSDELLFNNGEDGWIEYGQPQEHAGVTGDFSSRVKTAYQNFLADSQILED